MRNNILSITGSDATGRSGVQSDVKTIWDLGGNALSAITAVAIQGSLGVQHVHDLPTDLVVGQVCSILEESHPSAVKIGLLCDTTTIVALGQLLKGVPRVVCAPGVLSTDGRRLADDAALEALKQHILPLAELLIIRCSEAELLLGRPITTDEDMLSAATTLQAMGVRWVMLRGGRLTEGRCTALLQGGGGHRFFSSYNIEGWLQHGVGGALSAAIATRMAFGDDVPTAVDKAHDYIHSQVVYAVRSDARRMRSSDLYNSMLSLVAQHYRHHHEVAFYADQLSVSTRYLGQMTNKYVGKSPKQVIDDYLLREAVVLLETSRLSVQEVSDRLGFSSQVAFCRFFKRHQGVSATEYRIN